MSLGRLLLLLIATGAVFCAVAVLRGMFTPTRGKKIASYPRPRKALLVMDVQESAPRGQSAVPAPLTGKDLMIAAINRLIDHFAARGMEVAYVRQVFESKGLAELAAEDRRRFQE